MSHRTTHTNEPTRATLRFNPADGKLEVCGNRDLTISKNDPPTILAINGKGLIKPQDFLAILHNRGTITRQKNSSGKFSRGITHAPVVVPILIIETDRYRITHLQIIGPATIEK